MKAHIEEWLAWAPGIDSKEHWRRWAKCSSKDATSEINNRDAATAGHLPETSFLPIALRKRLSGLTKISLWLAHTILEQQPNIRSSIETVFASRHGESQVTAELLREILRGDPLSPILFSRSVHNTASGIFGIAEKNVSAVTAVAAMNRTFEMGLVQAWTSLQRTEKILYIMADEPLPKEFSTYLNEPWKPYGVALLLSPGEQELIIPPHSLELPTALSFLRTLPDAQS